jgi:hypothetical protein
MLGARVTPPLVVITIATPARPSREPAPKDPDCRSLQLPDDAFSETIHPPPDHHVVGAQRLDTGLVG